MNRFHTTLTSRVVFLGKILSLIGPVREAAYSTVMWLPAKLRGRLLDVGCGSGTFLGHMQYFGWEVHGVEPDPKAASIAREALFSDNIHTGSLEEIDLEEKSFDVVTMSHVIEHLLEPVKILQTCYRLLKPGGLLVLTTPNSSSLGRKKFRIHWRGWELPRHIHIFNKATLVSLTTNAGFQVKSVKTPSPAAYFNWVNSLLIKKKALSPGKSTPVPTIMMKTISVFFWGVEYFLTRIGIPCGEEVLLVAERR